MTWHLSLPSTPKILMLRNSGSDVIKAQQAANLKYSSDQCAVIPEDRAQVMLAGVSDS